MGTRRFVRFHLTLLFWVAVLQAGTGSTADAVSQPRYDVEIVEAMIPMPDGVHLAADLYRPVGAPADEKLPVLLEYYPYRKDEARGGRFGLYAYFVERGYVVALVDIRGTGRSEGRLIPHEYSDQELDDGESIIAWLAAQPWSSGNVGMFGISWSGFNAIQMTVRNPPALKAIIAVDATEDLYQEDVHYMDGVIHVDSWEMSQDLYNAMPAAPDYVLDQSYFENRFDTEPWMLAWMRHQRDGEFWDRVSARGRYADIRIPTFHIGGWYDGYRDSLPRMLEHVKAPVKAMIGPWSHAWPHEPYPNPGMEWRHEAVRWFDQWLLGRDTGILDEPRFAVYVRDWHPPGPYLETAPGRWVWEDGWPVSRIRERRLFPQDNRTLASKKPREAVHRLGYVPSTGLEAGGPVMWWGDVAHDQRPSDAFSLVYETDPLKEDTEILGLPRAVLRVSADAPHANWFVRISDVAPDGTVTQVAGAGFNGTHRYSAREPVAIVPGEEFTAEIEMHFTSWVFPAGHRIRFAVANAQWPMHWPTPRPMTTSLRLGGADGSYVVLPVVPARRSNAGPTFLPIEPSRELPGFGTLETGTSSGYGEISSVDRNPQTGEVTATLTNGNAYRYPWGVETFSERIQHSTSDKTPEKTSVTGQHSIEVTMPQRVLRWEGDLTITSDIENFYYRYTRRLSENGETVREKTWSEAIPRDFQ